MQQKAAALEDAKTPLGPLTESTRVSEAVSASAPGN